MGAGPWSRAPSLSRSRDHGPPHLARPAAMLSGCGTEAKELGMASAPGSKSTGGGSAGGKGSKGDDDDNGLEDGMGDFSKVFDKLSSQMDKLTKMKEAADKGADPKSIKAMMDELKKTSKMFDGLEDAGKSLGKLLK